MNESESTANHPESTRKDPEAPDPTATGPDAEPLDPARGQVLLVRRRRTPALGFWVVLAVVVGALTGLVVAWTGGVRSAGGMLSIAATAVFFVGGPLALVAAIVDAVTHRRRRRTGNQSSAPTGADGRGTPPEPPVA